MAMNKAFVFNSVPSGVPIIGEHISIQPAAYNSDIECPEDGVFLKSMYASIDPYQRSRMRAAHIKSYQPALEPGSPLIARSIAQVQRSKHPAFRPGDIVVGTLPIQEYIALSGDNLPHLKQLDNPLGIEDIRVYLGALGVPGLTAYGGLYEIGKPERGQSIFISAASGAVGQMVGQLAKLEGLHTIGSVGSDEKLDYITSTLGFDAGFNYKKERPAQALYRLAPGGLDIYFDNVGGEHLEAAFCSMKDFGRVVMCGTIADYNTAREEQYPLRAYSLIFSKRLTVRGFIVSDKDIAPKYAKEHQDRVQAWVKEGVIRVKMWEVQGIEKAPEAFLALFAGGNFGKVVLKY
jgi:NADPH-dependent curcumin reductase CurA